MGLVRNLYLVLTNEQVRLQLQLNARQTAEQFKPVAIAERYITLSTMCLWDACNVTLLCKPDANVNVHADNLHWNMHNFGAITNAERSARSPPSCTNACMVFCSSEVFACRLEGVLYSLTSCSKELLLLRQPALADLQFTCAWASQACSKSSAAKLPKHGKENVEEEQRHE